jgi:hypothetical protein
MRMAKHEFNPAKVFELSVVWEWFISRKVIQYPRFCWVLPLSPALRFTSRKVPLLQKFEIRDSFQVFRAIEILLIDGLILLNNLLGKLKGAVVFLG